MTYDLFWSLWCHFGLTCINLVFPDSLSSGGSGGTSGSGALGSKSSSSMPNSWTADRCST